MIVKKINITLRNIATYIDANAVEIFSPRVMIKTRSVRPELKPTRGTPYNGQNSHNLFTRKVNPS